MSGGYVNRFLKVNLTSQELEEGNWTDQYKRSFLGGYGLGARYLYDHLPKGVNPLSENNILGFITGPLTGTPAIGGSRYTVVAKSPLTSGWGDANCGGNFGPHLKFSGFDAIFFHGRSKRPTYLLLRNGNVELREADHLWGLGTDETATLLKNEFGKSAQIACIGPAGERLSLISGIMNGSRAAARSGLGAVMGSKNLKAIVAVGNNPVPLAKQEKARALRKELVKCIGGSFAEIWQKYGTCGALAGCVEIGDAPVKNWAGGGLVDFPTAHKISDDSVIQYQTRRYGCWQCPVACGGEVVVPEVEEGRVSRKPEYETLAAFGPLCLNDDLQTIIKLNNLCNQSGLDTISTGTVVAFAMECFEKGILSSCEVDGLDLTWGNSKSMLALVEKIIRREGIGDLLADGVQRGAEKIGRCSEEIAIHIGGQELPMHDPRLTMPFLLGYLLDATPGRHNQGSAALIDMPKAWVEKAGAGISSAEGYERKTEEHFKLANLVHVINSSGLCLFDVCSFTDRFILPEFLEAVVGWDLSNQDLFHLGEKIGTLRLAFNYREGVNPLVWHTPKRVLGQPPLELGPLKGVTLDINDELKAFRLHAGWDPKSGKPGIDKLQKLGLEDLIQDLWPEHKGIRG